MLKDFYETKDERRRKIRKEQKDVYGYEMEKEWVYYENDEYVEVVSGDKIG